MAWEYAPTCTGSGDTTLTVEISAYDVDDPDTTKLSYSGTVFSCDDIAISEMASPVRQPLSCFAGSLTMLSVTVKDEQDNTDTIETMWESAICEEGCEENDEGRDSCPEPD